MARTLLQPNKDDHATAFHFHASAPATSLLLLLVVAAAVAAVVVSLCTSGKNARPRRRSSLAPAPQPEQEQEQDGGGGISRNKQLLASLSGIGVKAAAVAKMVSWNRRSPPASGWSSGDDGVAPDRDGDGTAEEEALWKKTIILGDKCRPLEFSGHIAHDSDGNPMQPQPSAINKDATNDAAAEV